MIAIALLLALSAQQADATVPVKATGAISGRVLRTDGRPLARAGVVLSPADALTARVTTARHVGGGAMTDAEGHYEFRDLPAGRYRLTAAKTGYTRLAYGQRRAQAGVDPIVVGDGQVLEHLDFTLPKYSAIVGYVFDENGDPVEGARVQVSQLAFVNGRRQLTDVFAAGGGITNDQGRYRIFGLEPGQYIVRTLVGQVEAGVALLPGYAPTYYPGALTPAGAQTVAVELSTDVTDIDLPLMLAPTARVMGRALNGAGEPITGGLSMQTSQRSGAVGIDVGAIINADGTFIFPNVAPGEYVIQALKSRANSSTEGEFASQFVTVAGEDVTGVLLRMTTGSAITGHVTFEDGVAPKPGDIEISPQPADFDRSPSGGSIARAEIADDWTFEVSGVNGPRRLRLTGAPAGWFLKAIRANGADVTDSVLTFGKPDQSLQGIEVVLSQQGAEIAGTVADGRDAPVSDASVIVYSTDSTQWYSDSRFMETARAKSDGTFRVQGLPSGDYYVVAVDRLRGDDWQDPALLESLVPKASHLFATEGQTATAMLKLVVR